MILDGTMKSDDRNRFWNGDEIYQDYYQDKKIDRCPQMIGFQAEGSAPIVLGYPVLEPKTIATAIKIGNPASWKSAERAAKESGGNIDSVTDEEILQAYKMLASLEGVFCEPASAASLAGVIKKSQNGYFPKEKKSVVCVLTGHGLKDPERAIEVSQKPDVLDANMDQIVEKLELK